MEPLATLNAIEDFLFPRVHRQSSAPAANASGSAGGDANGAPARQSSGDAGRVLNAKLDDEPADEPEEEEDEEMFGEDRDEGEGRCQTPPADAVEDVDPVANGESRDGAGSLPERRRAARCRRSHRRRRSAFALPRAGRRSVPPHDERVAQRFTPPRSRRWRRRTGATRVRIARTARAPF